jgi:Undecaprenyl-phosphate glucose phosphotransferase
MWDHKTYVPPEKSRQRRFTRGWFVGDLLTYCADLMRVADFIAIGSAALLAGSFSQIGAENLSFLLLLTLAGSLVYVHLLYVVGGYDFRDPSLGLAFLRRAALVWSVCAGSLFALLSLMHAPSWLNNQWWAWWAIFGLSFLCLSRLILVSIVYRWSKEGRLARQIFLLVGDEVQIGTKLLSQLQQAVDRGQVLLKLYLVDKEKHPQIKFLDRWLVAGGLAQLINDAQQFPPDHIVIVGMDNRAATLRPLLQRLAILPVDSYVCPGEMVIDLPVGGYHFLNGMPMLQVQERPLSIHGQIIKAITDRFLAGLGLIILTPLLILIALAIKVESPGPVLFKQRRHGFNNNEITIYKFRTMWHGNHDLRQATRADPRVTRLGRFLRRTSLDELPQLFNVIEGSMSLVGPRPHAIAHNDQYANTINDYLCRHKMKPGITGWAQVNGYRGECDTEQKMVDRLRHDLYYIENWSIGLDIRILLLTLVRGFVHENAY